MINAYHRPQTLEEVLALQALGLNRTHKKGNSLEVGAITLAQRCLHAMPQ